MTDREKYFNDLRKQATEDAQNEKLMAALNMKLPNTSEPTDYSLWIKGCEQFAKDNPNFLSRLEEA